MRPVVVLPYDPRWPMLFTELAEVYARTLHGLATAIEHVGSTSVPGLAAKPTIDIDVVIPARDLLPEAIQRLSTLGSHHQGDLDVPGREAFSARDDDTVPRDGSGRRWPRHNLYVCAADSPELRRHLRFRDFLRAHPDEATAYAALKLRLAELHRDDRDAYTNGKTDFIERALTAGCTPAPGS